MKDMVIIYFSGTGNTELISQKLADIAREEGYEVDCISIEDIEAIDKLSMDNKIVGFGYPVYKFTYPDNFNRLFQRFNDLGNKTPCFLFSTYARFPATANIDFASHLTNDAFKVLARRDFKAPSCGISARKPSDDYEYESVMFFEDDIKNKLKDFLNEIQMMDVQEVQVSKGGFRRFRRRLVEDIEITKYPKLQIDVDRCNACGLCAKKCPDHNLVMTEGQVKVVDDKGCLHCLRCMNRCPKNAISFGRLSQGDYQYSISDRDRFYEASASGEKNPYWEDFDQVVKKWRKNTLKYYLGHLRKPEY